MIKLFKFTIVFAVTLLIGSCATQDNKMSSSGGNYEVFVVCPQNTWQSELGDTLRAILLEPVAMINQKEPIFDLAHVPASAYKGLILQHRNLLNINIGKEYPEAQLLALYDQFAAPQIVISLNAPSIESATSYIWENRSNLVSILEIAERERSVAFNKKYNELAVENAVNKKFGFNMSIPRGYTLRNQQDNFLWISNELPLASQGIVIYTYPYNGKTDFTVEQLIKRRNEFVSKIPGQLQGTYMTSSDFIEPDIKYLKIKGRYWSKMNGFWDVHNDFMGGPFVSYSTIDAENQRIICLDMYVYSPKHRKRNYLRALENLVYTVKFPSDKKLEETKK